MPDVPSDRWAIERPADGDFINTWPAVMRDALDKIDALMAGIVFDDPRPAAGVAGRFHRNPTSGVVSLDTGSGWIEMSRSPHADAHLEGGPDPVAGQVPIGGVIPYAGSVLPLGGAWAWADGHLEDRTTFDTFFARVGHAYNGGVDPGSNKVRLPDKRGRVPMGADNFGTGAAGRVLTGASARGAGGGSERVQLVSNESGLPAHAHSMPTHNHGATSSSERNDDFLLNIPAFAGILGNAMIAGSPGFNAPYADNSNAWVVKNIGHAHVITVNQANPGNTNNNGAAGAAASHQNLQPYEADNYIVRLA